ncbi:DnaB-like helicase C-terminal domain-containing protein [Hyphomicrobium sp.]|uniref:replicative DNA helicase n=1 Tax=Hyphomicrobium sp. TaxID=82 RepID=UPI001D2A36A6|nr:DnaB-like helicase C-terminal domain-containing protein [Hyphomicrobium sp.]MBY0561461.1 AAA family ATPase [Hyphomicrobium sp.]
MADGTFAPFQPRSLEPHNAEAEGAIVGACLGSPKAFHRISGLLEGIDFFDPLYADCWKAMRDLGAQDRRADLVTLAPVFAERKVGDMAARDHLDLLVASYSGHNLPPDETLDAYVNELRRYSAQRLLAKAAKDLGHNALAPDPVITDVAAKALNEIDNALMKARGADDSGAYLGKYAKDAIELFLDENAPRGLPTGLKELDAMTGGLYRGDLSIVGGRPGSGKTTVGAQLMMNVAKRGFGTLMVSMEMGGIPVAERCLVSDAFSTDFPIPYTLFRTDKLAKPEDRRIGARELARLRDAQDRLKTYPLYIEQRPGLTIAEIGSLCRKLKAQYQNHGRDLDFVVVDYLGLVSATNRYAGQKVNEVGEISNGLKQLAKNLNVHVMALHQLSRGVESRDDKRPQLQDLRDSGNIEQDADLVLFAYRESYYLERAHYDDAEQENARLEALEKCKYKMELNIAKQRAGMVGSAEYFCRIDCNVVRDSGFGGWA